MATLVTKRKLSEDELDLAILNLIPGFLQQEAHHVFYLRTVASGLKDTDLSLAEIRESLQRLFNTGKVVLEGRIPTFTTEGEDKLNVSFVLVFAENWPE